MRQRAQVKRRALPEPWSEQAAPEPQGIKAQPINTTAGFSPLPLSPRGCSPEGVVSAKGWARGSVSCDVGASQVLASVSAQGVCCVLRTSGGACDGARAGHKTPPRALPTSLYTPPQPSHGASIRRAHLCARRGAGGSPRVLLLLRRNSATRIISAANDAATTTTATGKRLLPQGSASRRDSATRGRAAADVCLLASAGD